MGQKVNPISFRIDNGNKRVWNSNWFSKNKKDYESKQKTKPYATFCVGNAYQLCH